MESACRALPQHSEAEISFLPGYYNFILFFSLPFVVRSRFYRSRLINQGHLTVSLGDTVYQLHDPQRLQSKFLVSRMPQHTWLFEDGRWVDWDPASPTYRHVHLFETSEVNRTVVCYAALRNFPARRLAEHAGYFDRLEHDFHAGRYAFKLWTNNCTTPINQLLYREGWIRPGLYDRFPAVAFKRLVRSWYRQGLDFTVGMIDAYRRDRFAPQRVCLGLLARNPDQAMAAWIRRHTPPRAVPHCLPCAS